MRLIYIFLCLLLVPSFLSLAQENALVNTSKSPYAKLYSPDADAVKWTGGFWGQWYDTSRDTMVINMLRLYENDSLCHGFCNFEIAAGIKEGEHAGAPFHDGDFYKTLEAVVSLYAQSGEKRLYNELERVIPVIAKAQRADGYIHTPTLIDQINHPDAEAEFADRMNFETYNLGHLMTAACLHYRVSGQSNFLDVAIRASDFLVAYHEHATAEQARNAICPSHYMGVIEMYRTTGDKRYLALAKKMIDIRGLISDGSDHNQDRIPFRQQREAVGHAVRANYLYAGVADLYAETGEDSLMMALTSIWNDVAKRKLYVTGACGALYDGVSPNGTTYDPSIIQQVHQAYGQAYQLPNMAAHNESCANIGNVLWNFRMLQITGETKYADMMELTLYNSVLSGTDLGGTKFNYTNPLRVDDSLSYTLRWSKERVPYIAWSNCCPPNVVRTVSEVNNYAYSLTKAGVMVNLYGSNTLATKLADGSEFVLRQETDYPWSGEVSLSIEKVMEQPFEIGLRIPAWAESARISVNGELEEESFHGGQYATLQRKWKKGDVIELTLPMDVQLIEANPLVEEARNQIAVKRGPVVYCIESPDFPDSRIFDVRIPSDIQMHPEKMEINGTIIMALDGSALLQNSISWEDKLYRQLTTADPLEEVKIRLIPYFAWGNRGHSEMSVWMPVNK